MKQYYKFIFKSYKKNIFITIYLILRLFIFRKLSFLDKKYFKDCFNRLSNYYPKKVDLIYNTLKERWPSG